MPLPSVRFTPILLRLAIFFQHVFGVPLTALAHIVGSKTHNNPKMSRRNVDAHGNNPTAITGSIGDQAGPSTTTYSSSWPRSSCGSAQNTSLRRRTTSRPPTSSRTISSPCSGLHQSTSRSSSSMASFRMFPYVDTRGSRLSELLHFTGSSRLGSVETLVDIKGLGIGKSSDYISFCTEVFWLIHRRAVKVHKEYCKAAKDLGSSQVPPNSG